MFAKLKKHYRENKEAIRWYAYGYGLGLTVGAYWLYQERKGNELVDAQLFHNNVTDEDFLLVQRRNGNVKAYEWQKNPETQ